MNQDKNSVLATVILIVTFLILPLNQALSETFQHLNRPEQINPVVAVCPNCHDKAKDFNGLAIQINRLNRQLYQEKRSINDYDRRISTETSADKRKSLTVARAKALSNLKPINNQVRALTRKLNKARNAFRFCQNNNCKRSRTAIYTTGDQIPLLKTNDCKACGKIAQEYNAVVKRIARIQHLIHQRAREAQALGGRNNPEIERKAAAILRYRTEIKKLGIKLKQLRQEYKLCLKKYCGDKIDTHGLPQ